MRNETKIRELLLRVPHPGEAIPEGVSDEELARFTAQTGIDIPLDVAGLLKLSNAPYIDSQALLGITDNEQLDMAFVYTRYPGWQKRGWLPIGIDGCGNFYVIPTNGELGKGYPVLFVEAVSDPDEPQYIVASDVEHFVEFIIERELKLSTWPFNKDELLIRDPQILRFHGVNLPWEAL